MAGENGGWRVVSEPTPGVTPPPPSPGDHDAKPTPEPTPSPSPGPPPKRVPPWGPDIGVTPSWLRQRADACDETAVAVNALRGAADDTFAPLGRSAPGWAFAGSVDELRSRWDGLNDLLHQRLAEAAENFRLSADAYTKTDSAGADAVGGGRNLG
ncbi:type VII secretion target [Amycolatopsis sp. OK19-0408]|uniref:Type VII secretion target n=1 Tax=Amycolatopsis iheyensis TaxID=2945988 RepID=A0A9X2N7E4_9PSEU|nr:type VII secretion target [Amycolatopsis iheyensis]MCR6483691.1 type VII secretion target [Amycolatopsis iheyensis]